ncbi:MAG: DUF1579 family protein, partial [Gammaproteobacteria bacterium]|nr:DUF1579 family protein [Gammaproteobacteria bacterium]
MRKHQQRLPLLLAAVFSAATQANEPSPSPGLDVLENFVGRWQGTATAYFPRQPERESRHEQVQASCEKALEGTYVECRSIWTDTNGATRELRMFWNFHAREDRFEILYLYDNWPGKVQYKIEYNADTGTLTGRDSFQGPGGV